MQVVSARALGTTGRAIGGRLAAAEPWVVLVPLVVGGWLAVLAFALTVRHNGWLFYQGGDETFYWTDAWAFSQGRLPEAAVGWGWSYLLSPLPLFAGTNLLAALPAITLLNVLVLGPIATLSAYGIGARLGGRIVGYLSAAVWVAMPYVGILLFVDRYHDKYVEQFLPQALGLTGMADYPSMVALLAAAYFAFRTLDDGDAPSAALCGLLAGFAAAIKPANLLFLAAPVVAFPLARRWRSFLPFAAGLALPLIALYVWKVRGFRGSPVSLGPGVPGLATTVFATLGPLDRYVTFSWERVKVNYISLREVFWSTRMLEFALPAGIVAAALRSLPKAAFLALWFGTFFVVKGGSDRATVDSGSFFRLIMPGFPAYLLLVAAIPLLVPTLGRTLTERFAVRPRPLRLRSAAAAGVVLGLVPLVLIVVAPPLQARRAVNEFTSGVFIPVTGDLHLRAASGGGTAELRWRPPPGSHAGAFYRIFRSPPSASPDPQLPPARDGVRCLPRSLTGTDAARCQLEMQLVGSTQDTSFTTRVPDGLWTYRVAVGANWVDDPQFGDILMVSGPIHLRG